MLPLLLLTAISTFSPAVYSPAVYAPLELYAGTWQVSPGMARKTKAENKPDILDNECQRIDVFYACEQIVNGERLALILFVPIDGGGNYYTQPIGMDGKAKGRGKLAIKGDSWTYSGEAEVNGKRTWYRTTNLFAGKDHIHFESAKSADGAHWEVTASGDEVRLPASKSPPALH